MIGVSEHPAWPTATIGRLRDGRLRGTDGSLWLYRAVPLSPVDDAKTPMESLEAAEPLVAFFEELADLTNVTVKRRAMAKGAYRQVHMLLVNIPTRYSPPLNTPLGTYLRQEFPDTAVSRRLLLVGVRLVDKITSGGLRQAVDSVVETIVAGQTPLADFDADTRLMSAAMDRSGLIPVTAEEIRLANSWWNRGDYADAPTLVHPDHIHVFDSVEAVRLAEKAGEENCFEWTPETVPGTHAVTFASVQDLDLNFVDPRSTGAHWISDLVQAGALAVSIRGNVEPGVVTRDELRRQRKRFIDDINDRANHGKMQRAEQEEMLGLLEAVEGLYATSGSNPPPTLAGASVLVAFNGQYRDITQAVPAGAPARLSLMAYRQNGALEETWLCSSARANPNLHDLPAQTLAYSGLPSLSFVGDREGALLGFTERDRQPALVSPIAASRADGGVMMLVAGGTGSGKSQVLQWLAKQYTLTRRPSIIWDPKSESDFTPVVESVGGQVYSLDALLRSDGALDPIRFSPDPTIGVEIAADMLLSVNPWGSRTQDMEVPLLRALSYGVEHGGTCIGQSLAIAKRDIGHELPPGLVEAVEQVAASSPQFRAVCGVSPSGEGLRAFDGLTLIKVGSANLRLPEPGQRAENLQQRIGVAIVKMVVFGSATALMNRDGIFFMDEAWMLMESTGRDIERLGRVARSQRVFPVLFTQRVTDALKAGIKGYISRGIILPLPDEAEAVAACEMFDLEPTPGLVRRITAKAEMGGNSTTATAPNWESMRALRDPATRRVLRGTVGIYADLAGRAVPVEIRLPQGFLADASTSPEDIARREAAAAQRAAALAQAARAAARPDAGGDPGGRVLDEVFNGGPPPTR